LESTAKAQGESVGTRTNRTIRNDSKGWEPVSKDLGHAVNPQATMVKKKGAKIDNSQRRPG